MSISPPNSLTLTPGQGSISTNALTPGVGGDALPNSRGYNHDSSKAQTKADSFKPPPLTRQPAFRAKVGLKRPRALTAGGTPYGLMTQQSPIRSTQAEVAARIAWPQAEPEAPKALRRRKRQQVAAHDVGYDSPPPSAKGCCQIPETPVKYGGFTNATLQRNFIDGANHMSEEARDVLFANLLQAELKAEACFDEATIGSANYALCMAYHYNPSLEGGDPLDVLECTRADALRSLRTIRAKIGAMSKIGVMSN